MLVVMIALVSLINMILGLLPEMAGASMTLERMLGWIMIPFAWLLGVPWDEAETAGKLLGMKVVFNEFIAYLELVQMGDDVLDPRSRMILVYALCGFANLGCLGIMIGGLLSIAPERRDGILSLAPKSILLGVIGTSLTGCVIGMLYQYPDLRLRELFSRAGNYWWRSGSSGSVMSARSGGKRSVTVVPAPGLLSSESSPPWSSVKDLDNAKPRPVPLVDRSIWPSTCSNGSRIRRRSSGSMPIPVSSTEIKRTPRSSRPA